MNNPIPGPVTFSIDAAQSARLRKALFAAGGERAQLMASGLLSLAGIFNAVLQARLHGWQHPMAFGPASFYVAYFTFMLWRTFERCTVKPQTGTLVTFGETGISIERDAAARTTRIPFARIRSVRVTPDTIAVYGIWTTYVTIPKGALPDGGIRLLEYFSEHIVSKGMPVNSSHGVTTIFNSVSPVLARR